MRSKYDSDYYGWAMDTAASLRAGRLDQIDAAATAEEIEGLGKWERRRLHGALVQLFLHLLKSKHQPNGAASWPVSIEKQRRQIGRIIEDNSSLKPLLSDPVFLDEAYGDAVLDAVIETGLSKSTFPVTCPFSAAETKLPQE
jgi:hypothetical protein